MAPRLIDKIRAAFARLKPRTNKRAGVSHRAETAGRHREAPPTSMQTGLTFVDSQESLAAALEHLRPHRWLALDTEADNLHHYETRVCLLQLAAGGRQFLIDTLCGLDLRRLFELLATRSLIMHGSDYDLRLLWELTQFRPVEVFDTMLAAQLIGRERIGLSSLLDEFLGVHHPKDSQKSDWSRRPLPEKMLRYAAGDVAHLHRLHELLSARLEQLGRSTWHQQKCAWQIEVALTGFPRDNDQGWRLGPSRGFPPRALAALYELWHWRESEAKRLDRPPFKVMSSEYLLKLSLAVADDSWRDAFDSLPVGLRRGPSRGLLDALERGTRRDPKSLPRRPEGNGRPPPLGSEELSRQDAIRDFRDRLAEDLALDPTLIVTRSQIAQLARQPEEAERLLLPWQVELLRPVLGTNPPVGR
jgi:ribonuclease D